ncbi:uncharacterized protein [Lolium perenne]|nr:uncharacterized protein LOC127305562 isoform X2 [Lolium perenne]
MGFVKRMEFVKLDDGWTFVRRKVPTYKENNEETVEGVTPKSNSTVHDAPYPPALRKFARRKTKSGGVLVYSGPDQVDPTTGEAWYEVVVPWTPPQGSRRHVRKMFAARRTNYVNTKFGPGYYSYGTFGDFGLEY